MRLRIVLGAIVLAVVAIFAFCWMRHTIRLTGEEIQSELARKFPLEKHELIFTLRFTDPVVDIDSATGHVRLGVNARATALGEKAIATHAEVEGAVRYDESTEKLFLDSPVAKIERLEVAGLPERYRGVAKGVLEEGLREYLGHVPLYHLRTRRMVKSIHVRDGALEIELGL